MKTKAILPLFLLCAFAGVTFAGVEQSVNDLIPRLAAEKVEDRYSAQMELQALAAKSSRPGAETDRAELAKVLAAKVGDVSVPQPARVWMVRQLEHIGAGEAVAALTTLLNGTDAELKETARRALERNLAPAATASLRAALEKGGETSWKIGLIRSLGERGDAQSVSLIAQHLSSSATALAAASALATVANDAAVKELWSAFEKKNASAADGLVAAAKQLAFKGEGKKATAIYARLYGASTTVALRAAALTGLAKTDPAGAKKLIPEALSGSEIKLQDAAVAAAREVYGKKASEMLVDMLPKLNASGKMCVFRALDSSAEKQVIGTAADPSEAVKIAAFETLARIGSGASVPVLMKGVLENSGAVQKAASSALARISGPGASAAVTKLAGQGDAKSRAAAMGALAERHDKAAISALLQYAGESDRAVSSPACVALGKLGGDTEIEPLMRLALAGKSPGAAAALEEVASRATDKPAAAQKLVQQLQGAGPQQCALLFNTLAVIGGDEALTAISGCISDKNEEVKDAAVRAMANWADFSAAKPLLAIAKDANAKPVHQVLAVQGVAKLVRGADKTSAQERVDAALAAMEAAKRDEERKLLLSALAAVPHAKAAEAIKPFLKDAKFQAEAGLAGATLAQALVRTDRTAAKSLAQAVKDANISDELTRRADAVLRR